MSRTTTTPAGDTARRSPIRSSRRSSTPQGAAPWRRPLLAGAFLLLLAAIVLANQGPVRDLLEGRAQLAAKERQVAEIEKGNQAYKAEIARLEKASYLEALARKQLAYAKPGEDVFIIQGLPSSGSLPGSGVTPSQQAAQDAGVAATVDVSAGQTTLDSAATDTTVEGTSGSGQGTGDSGDVSPDDPQPSLFQRIVSALRGLL